MSEVIDQPETELPLEGAGQRLMRARQNAGKTIEQIAAETRIPIRHLQVIEAGDFAALPARTYAIGFSRTYARAVGVDEGEIADMVRSELSDDPDRDRADRAAKFEPGDPARIPSRKLAWFSAFALLLLIVGAFAFFRDYFVPGSGPRPIVEPTEVAQSVGPNVPAGRAAQTAPDPTGAVVFTSLADNVWVKFYDKAGERLMERQLAKGERYSVPADADGPQIWTGQPEMLEISIGGKRLGMLSRQSEIVRDIPVTAEALVAREKGQVVAAAAAGGAGATTSADGG